MKRENIKKMSFPSPRWTGRIGNLPRLSLFESAAKRRSVEDPRLQSSGMSLCYNTASAFTLIELLVVVLIIGILAAVALPQYNKAILKSRMIESLAWGRAVQIAQHAYFLENGEYTSSGQDLDIEVPSYLTKHFYSTMYGSSAQTPRFIIRPTTTADWQWSFHFKTNAIFCHASTNNTQAQQVCASMTHDNNPEKEGTTRLKYKMQ